MIKVARIDTVTVTYTPANTVILINAIDSLNSRYHYDLCILTRAFQHVKASMTSYDVMYC